MPVFHPPKISPEVIRALLIAGASLVFGLGWFLLLYGRYPLYFSHLGWIYEKGGDVFQHHIGWEWFRREPWGFPIGRIAEYGYPFGTTLSYLDAIPLFAIPLKLFSSLLGARFQYLGLWELSSVVLQFLLGLLLLGEFTRSFPLRVLGASLLVLSPPMIQRTFYHNSLSAQWILLTGIWFVILAYRKKLRRWAWPALFAVALLVHLYFVAMLAPLWLVSLYFSYRKEKRPLKLGLDILTVPAVLLGLGYAVGLFGLKTSDLDLAGFGLYSWNLNGFFNPQDYSAFFKALPSGVPRPGEGFSYLGLGSLLLLPLASFLFLQGDPARRRLSFFLPLGLACIPYLLYSLSNQAFSGASVLWNFQLPPLLEGLFSMFRTNGRFIWPVFYLITVFGLVVVMRNIRHPAFLLLAAVALQYVDIQPLIDSRRFDGFTAYQSPLQADFWPAAAENNHHVLLLPSSERATGVYTPFAVYAAGNGLTLNYGYFARADHPAIEAYGEQVLAGLQAGQADDSSIYILWKSNTAAQFRQHLPAGMLLCQADGFTVLISAENQLVRSGFDLEPYCSLPSP